MGMYDRDWYRDEVKRRDRDSSRVKRATYNPRMFRRARNVDGDRSGPPEPHEWPILSWVLIWLVAVAFATFVVDVYRHRPKPPSALEQQMMNMMDCDFVASGPCMKIVPARR